MANQHSTIAKRIKPEKHGHYTGRKMSPEYHSWHSVKNRCLNPNHKSFKDYGGSGITICDRWKNSFCCFLADMGLRPGPKYSIDRYPDKNGNYEPGNCRWATVTEQLKNRRITVFITAYGNTLSCKEWAEKAGIPHGTLCKRVKRGWPPELALSTPVMTHWSRQRKGPHPTSR